MAKNPQTEIRLQIISTEREKFYLEDLEELDGENIGQDDIEFSVEISLTSNLESESIKVDLIIDVIEKTTKKALFGISTGTVFYSPDYHKLVDKNDNIIAPEDFLRKLMNISIGGTRGMLAILLTDSDLSHLTLPLIDLGGLKEKERSKA